MPHHFSIWLRIFNRMLYMPYNSCDRWVLLCETTYMYDFIWSGKNYEIETAPKNMSKTWREKEKIRALKKQKKNKKIKFKKKEIIKNNKKIFKKIN